MVEQPSILLIEDDAHLRQPLQIILQGEGYRVVTAANGAEGIQKAQAEPFDLVLTDLVMPDMDGFQVMDNLKVHCPDIVVVAITGYASLESAIEVLRKGAYDYLSKPFDFDLLHIVIRRALEKSRLQQTLRHYTRELERQVEERTRELIEANQRLEQSLAELQAAQAQVLQTERLRALGTFMAAVAHELSNPLTVIIALGQALAQRAPAAEGLKTQLEHISEAASRCDRVVTTLLSFAQQQVPQKVSTDLNALCEKTLHALAYQVNLSRIVLEKRMNDRLPKIMADPHQLQQVFTNIVLNAYQAMMRHRGRGTLVVETKRGDGVIQIAFYDDGPGIPREYQGKIFDLLFTTRASGTGLGLTIADGIVKAHGGRLTVHSTPGQGTTVLVELPIMQPALLDRPSAPGNLEPCAKTRVLVAETAKRILSSCREI